MTIPVNAASVIYKDALVMIDADGFARPAAALANNQGCPGIAIETVTGGAADGDVSVVVLPCEALFTATSALQTDLGLLYYASTDNDVDETQGANEPVAGRMTQFVSSTQVWLKVQLNP